MQTRNEVHIRSGIVATVALLLASVSSHLHANPNGGNSLLRLLTPPVVAAHRADNFVPGTPLEKVHASLQAGDARVLEMDLRLSRDNVVVVAHDDKMHGSGSCVGDIENFSFAELSACQQAIDGQPMTRFADVLDTVHGRAVINAEFKSREVIAPAIALVEAKHAKSWVYFQATGDLTKYHMARNIDADVALLLKVTSDAEIQRAIALHDPHLLILEMDRDFITAQRVARIHAAGLLVSENSFRYQFSEERFVASCDHVFSLGVDIAVTNNPASCKAQRWTWNTGHSDRFSSPFDRQHLRADFGGNKLDLELFLTGFGTLLVFLPIKGRRLLSGKPQPKHKPA